MSRNPYVAAVLLAFAGVALRGALSPVLGASAPLLISLLPVIVAAWYGGVATGILAAVVGGTMATYFFVEPARSFDLSHTPDFARVVIFSCESLLAAWLIGTRTVTMQREAVQKVQLLAARDSLERANRELEARVQERTALLEELNLQLQSFTYSVSHDLRAPLRGVSGYARALLEDHGSALDAQANEYVRRILAEAERLDRLIVDLLSFSRLQRAELRLAPMRVDDLMKLGVAELAPEIAESRARVELRIGDEEVMVARPVAVQVFVNLLSNALKFVPSDRVPVVCIAAERRGECVRITLEDNGIGIDAGDQERIFGAFERLHGEERFPGSGIGLAIVKTGTERLGGRVGVHSKPGRGSTFWVELRAAG